jgi:tetratricopeptide (TPR) repeat protein
MFQTGGLYRGRLFALLLVLNVQAAAVLLDTPERREEFQQDITAARRLALDGAFDDSLAIFTRLLNQYVMVGHQQATLHHDRGLVYLGMNNLDAAWDDFSMAIKLDDSLAEPHAMLGNIAVRREKYIQAEDLYSRALKRQPLSQPGWYLARASIFLKLDRLQAASFDVAQLPDSIRKSSDGLILQAQLALARNDGDNAAGILKRAVEAYPDHVGILLLYANLLRESGQFEDSLLRASQILARHPDHAKARHIRGLSFLQLNRNQEAVEDFSLLIARDQSQPSFYVDRSLAFFRLDTYEAALADCNAALKLQPELPIVHYRRGLIFSRLKKYGPAYASYTQALKLNKKYADAWFARGSLNDQSEYFPAALEDYTKTLELNPDRVMALCLRGRIFVYQNKFAKARKDYERALELSPEFAYAWFLMGRLLEKINEYEEALHCYEKALQFQEDDNARFSRAAVRRKMGDVYGATDDYLKLLEVETYSLASRQHLADLFLKSEEWENAFAMASKVVKQNDALPEGRWLRAQAAFQLDKLALALADVEWLIDQDAPTTDIWRLKGDVLSRLDRKEDALASYRQSLAHFQGNTEAWLGRAILEKKLSQLAEALESFRNVIRLSPDRTEAYLGIASILETQVVNMKSPEDSVEVTSAAYEDILLERSKRIEEILECYAEGERKGGESLDLYLSRADFLMFLGRRDAAKIELNRCLQIDPDHPRVIEMLSGFRP